ncbi:MAG: 2-C-methyl-D-erythritol 4-phosphate cytidylyltransferase [Actinomycetia bacterium]|nr:2-C-methyl-D-erythritol 4-phosphate cytidylyltransferase [Actinomycetes bacterium]MCH9700866.1 2-C-methyl-D-erythritol 4-phosphate cytidylyltransferase [Actinomycetes bacterium]MCH9759558.1 2-C-methyl-D-erythritol 4-phosphate cytidylyltransferase [Actinomycetes bacterium]
MAVTAILPVPVGFAERRDAVFGSVAGMSPLVRIVRALETRCDVVIATTGALADDVREDLVGQGVSRVRVVVSELPGERAQCVAAGLRQIAGGGHVLVHDIQWPILGGDTLDRIVAALRGGAVAVMLASPVTDSVKAVAAGGWLTSTLDRSQLCTVQYPRGFEAEALALLVKQDGTGRFDELESVLAHGTPLTLIAGDTEAVSVELPRDADYLAALIEGRQDAAGRREGAARP